jgi:hypothetical protein
MPRRPPPGKLFARYVTEEIRSTVKDASVAVRPRAQCGTRAGHMSPGSEPEAREQASDLRFLSWGGQDLNLRPTDYEFDSLTFTTCSDKRKRRLISVFPTQRFGGVPIISRSVAGHTRGRALLFR